MQLTGRNWKLAQNVQSNNPVRVTRGHKAGRFAPPHGFRYDGKRFSSAVEVFVSGLYELEKYEDVVGRSGFKVILFHFRRLPNQAPPPWTEPLDQQKWTDEQLAVVQEMKKNVRRSFRPLL